MDIAMKWVFYNVDIVHVTMSMIGLELNQTMQWVYDIEDSMIVLSWGVQDERGDKPCNLKRILSKETLQPI